MLITPRRNNEAEVVLLADLLDVIEVRSVGAAVDALADRGVMFTSDRRGKVGVLRSVADELRNEKAERDRAAAEEAERQRVEAERQQAEARERQKRLDEEQAAARARTEAYQARVRAIEERAGMSIILLEQSYRKFLATRPNTGLSVQGQAELAERDISLSELAAFANDYEEM